MSIAEAARDEAFQAAQDARTRLGVGNESRIPDLLEVIEETAGVPVFLEHLPKGMSGAYRLREGRPFILVSASVALVRQRFTIAHEYGHHALGHGSLVDTEETLRDYTTDPKEAAANYFAAEFLAPRRAVENWMQAHHNPPVDLDVVVRLADAFGISAAAARIRLQRARFLTNRRQLKDLEQLIEGGEHKYVEMRLGLGELTDELWRAQRHVPRKPGAVFSKALDAYEQGYISLDRAAEILEMPRSALERVVAERGIVVHDDESDPDFNTGETAPG